MSVQLRTRWPGCYIPGMPEKKMIGSNEKDYIEERMVLLDGFMKACGKYDYIIFSKEFKIFARGHGEVDKELLALPK